MCEENCQYPEKLKGKPDECTPEQIQQCHGDAAHHPCGGKKDNHKTSQEKHLTPLAVLQTSTK